MFIVGVDPGLASLGWGIISIEQKTGQDICYHAHGVITTQAKRKISQRLLDIERQFDALLLRYNPFVLAYEKQFFVKNVTSGLEVAHALGVILLTCAKRNIEVYSYTPLQIKKQITGKAQAKKEIVEKLVCLQFGIDVINIHHSSDALAVALTHCASIYNPF